MNTLEKIQPQNQKEFNPRKQDHGTAAERKGHDTVPYWQEDADRRGATDRDKELLKLDLEEAYAEAERIELSQMTTTQLEAEATKLLGDESSYTTESGEFSFAEEDFASQFDTNETERHFPTEAELGKRTRHEIKQAMARRSVAIDVDYADDDHGDNDYGSPIHVRHL